MAFQTLAPAFASFNPRNQGDAQRWAFLHGMEHEFAYRRLLAAGFPVSSNNLRQLPATAADLRNWSLLHQSEHEAWAAALNQNVGFDVSSFDTILTDPNFAGLGLWLSQHTNLHILVAQGLDQYG